MSTAAVSLDTPSKAYLDCESTLMVHVHGEVQPIGQLEGGAAAARGPA